MPRPFPPFTQACTACGWSSTIIPVSDVLVHSELLRSCPRCDVHSLELRPATAGEKVIAQFKRVLRGQP
jgi:hypothetical protein